jgi:hypothetical protein
MQSTFTDTQADQWLDAGFLDPEWFIPELFQVIDKQMAVVPFELNRMQRHLLENMTGRDIILKARQLGVSIFIQALMEKKVMFDTARVTTFADTYDNVQKLRDYGNTFYRLWPEDYEGFKPQRGESSIRKVTYPKTNSVSIIATAGAKTAGRAGTISDLHLSEFAYYADQKQVMQSALQAVTQDGNIVIESTANGEGDVFHGLCMDAMGGAGKWALHFYPWWWGTEYAVPLLPGEVITYTEEELITIQKAKRGGFDLTPEQIKFRRDKIADDFRGDVFSFLQEYPEDITTAFKASGDSVFGDFKHALMEDDQPQTEPNKEHRYVAGVDWGMSDDYTVISVLDATDYEEVHLERWRRMQSKIVTICERWGVEYIQPEKNSIGAVNIRYLAEKLMDTDLDITIRPFTMDNRKKQKLVQNFYHGIHQSGLKLLPYDYGVIEMQMFVQKQTETGLYKFEAAKNGKDDTVIARMLAYDLASKLVW